MRVLYILAILAYAAFGNAQNCNADGKKFITCMKDNLPKPDATEQRKIKECFDKNNCKVQESKPNNDNNKESQCFKKVEDILEQCLKTKAPTFPKPSQEDLDQARGPEGPPPFDSITCAQKDKVIDCLQALAPKNPPTQADLKKNFDQMCAAKKKCFSSMSNNCQSLLNKTKGALCDCAKSKQNQLDSSLKSCFPAQSDDNGPPPPTSDTIIEEHCGKDVCEEGFPDFSEHPEDQNAPNPDDGSNNGNNGGSNNGNNGGSNGNNGSNESGDSGKGKGKSKGKGKGWGKGRR